MKPPWTFFLVLLWTPWIFCNFNLFVTRAEVKRLLGLNAEMFYVREGVVNDYAMSWTVKVAPSIHSIYFHWQGLTKRPILYNMAVWTNKSSLVQGTPSPILDPTLNVSSAGVLPKKVGVFQVNMPCTGLISGEVEVILNLNVTSPKANQKPVSLYFSRKKICLKGVAAESFLPRKKLEEAEVVEEDDPLPLFAVIISAVTAVSLVLGIVIAGICWRKKQFASKNKCAFPSSNPPLFITSNSVQIKASSNTLPSSKMSPFCQFESSYTGPSGGTYTTPTMDTGNTYASVYKFPFQSQDILNQNHTLPKFSDSTTNYESSCYSIFDYKCDTNNSSNNSKNQSFGSFFGSKDSRESDKMGQSLKFKRDFTFERQNSNVQFDAFTLREKFKHLQMERERVRLTEVVQEGSLGRIYKGWLQRETPELDQQVWVKTVKEGSSASEVENLCKEGTLIFNLRHQNLMSLVGMSFAPKTPPFLIFPDPGGINLRVYLQSCGSFKVLDLVEIYLQAARGLHFMHANNVLHKDIAARNCVISENLHLRLTDSSLARDFFPEEYEGEDQNKPLRWMAPEGFEGPNNYTSQSDMWSFGILLWEMVNPSERPYESVHYKQILEFLEEGLRLNQPFACPDELYELMMACWNFCPDRRPSAFKASEFLTSFKQSLQSFV